MIDKNISFIDAKECTGCSACYNICPHGAITKHFSKEGFFQPKIKKDECLNCGLCISVCPVNCKELIAEKFLGFSSCVKKSAYAFINSDEKLRSSSSSGAFFSALVSYALKNNGVIFGAKFDNDFHVIHSSFSNKKDLYYFQGSKYVQSDIGYSFKECKKELDSGRLVLFSGSPCQIAGLLKYLGKNYENLITVDFICHGVPSPKLWDNYLQYKKKQFDSNILQVNFRDKKNGWDKYCLTFKFSTDKQYLAKNDIDCYMNLFLDDIALRESCYDCHFKGINRNSDFTMGDFWGVKNILPDFYDDKGVSLVFLNSAKGEKIFSLFANNHKCIKLSDEEIYKSIEINSAMIKSIARPNKRNVLDKVLEDNNVFSCYNNISRCTVGILNHVFSHNNYGALLVAFSMEKIVQEYGYAPLTIYLDFDGQKSIAFDEFRKKYLHITRPLKISDLNQLNKLADTFIIGSDQVWRNWWKSFEIFKVFFASFADYKKNIISYAASFGINDFPESPIDKARIKNLLSSFSAISVREKSGVDILKNEFGVFADCVLDPTLLIDKTYYESIIVNLQKKAPHPFITAMIFPGESSDNEKSHGAIRYMADNMNCEIVNIFQKERQLSIPEWLYYISNSQLNIVDSFHGLIFSIIFHKNFVCISNEEGGNERFFSILEICGLKDKLIYCNELNEMVLKQKAELPIKWDYVEVALNKEREKSRAYIEKALSNNVNFNSKVLYQLNQSKKNIVYKGVSFAKRFMKKIVRKFKK